MNNSTKILLALGLLAGLSACGGDDSKGPDKVDAGGPIVVPVLDGGKPDTGVVTTPDTGTPVDMGDGGTGPAPTDCFTGTPVQMVDFLNRCTSAQTTSKPTLGIPAALLGADGGVQPL